MKLSTIERPWLDKAAMLIEERLSWRGPLRVDVFNSDKLRERVTMLCGDPPNCNLWGILFAKLSNSGLIKRIGETRSQRPAANGRIVGVWRSKI